MLFVRGDGVILVRTSHILGAPNFKPLHAGFPAIEVMTLYFELERTVRSQSVYFYQLEQTRHEVGQSRTRSVLPGQSISTCASFQGFTLRFLRSLCLRVCVLLCLRHAVPPECRNDRLPAPILRAQAPHPGSFQCQMTTSSFFHFIDSSCRQSPCSLPNVPPARQKSKGWQTGWGQGLCESFFWNPSSSCNTHAKNQCC